MPDGSANDPGPKAAPDLEVVAKKVKKLIALAANAGTEEEGRTAAIAACKLIKQFELRVEAPLQKTSGFRPQASGRERERDQERPAAAAASSGSAREGGPQPGDRANVREIIEEVWRSAGLERPPPKRSRRRRQTVERIVSDAAGDVVTSVVRNGLRDFFRR